jgi:hypothetical protein|tara:strand:+ start:25 stop:396 length:372 start_codon:yes stop_codon:yes gene_type:complete
MAHFAELDNTNKVLRVIVVSNEDVDANGGDYSTEAEAFVETIVPMQGNGVAWKQTSYNNNSRKHFAGIGWTYSSSKNKFIAPKPYGSWTLDSNDDWIPPTAHPNDGKDYRWIEATETWEEYTL